MKPLRIIIKDFGAISFADIDLTGITVAAIAGPNGAGKSTAFTIAPMFALFGTTKPGTSADDMVRTGTTEAFITFDFEHHGDLWRVMRTRSTKGKGKTTLELQRRSGELWAAESGATIAETQKKIVDLINLDEETFLASSMIMQGKANEFTSRPAGQRKAILAQILQLDQYDTLQERARAKVTAVNMDLAGIRGKVADIDGRLAGRPALEGDKLATEVKLAEYGDAITKGEAHLQKAQTELATITARAEQADKIREQAAAAGVDVETKTAERGRQAERLEKANNMLAQEFTILEKAAEHDRTRDEITALRALKEQQKTLAAEGNRIKAEQAEVATLLETAENQVAEINDTLAAKPQLETAAAEYTKAAADLAEYAGRRQRHDELNRSLIEVQGKIETAQKTFEAEQKTLAREIELLTQSTERLKDAKCVDIERAECAFLADAKEAASKLPELENRYKNRINALAKDLEAERDLLLEKIDAVGFDAAEHARLQQLVADLQPKAERFAKLESLEPLRQSWETQRADLLKRKADLETRFDEAARQYRELTGKLEALPSLEASLATLEPWVKSREQLPVARQVQETSGEAIVRLDGEIAAATSRAEELQKEIDAIGDIDQVKRATENQVTNFSNMLGGYRKAHTEWTATLGGLQARLDAIDKDEAQRRILAAEMEPLAKQLTRWQTLVKAFGRDGIPALIIENAVPELERIANDILGQMSGGRNFLRFDTQKELKSRDGMAETLEIIVGDWAGERKYETFSGGEQLRIDFAIRFALAELLTRRAGNKIDWLVIDEGFGSQSEDYLPLVIDAVKEVTSRFGMVIVISHVRAVQEAFDQKIMFRPIDGAVEVAAA